ncbi:MAG: M56 family metallopeptidase [Cyanobacteriota bacterium]|nr:M56 family metallopeptidase [Cyanobacteriota bacterium]
MHLIMILLVISVAAGVRLTWVPSRGSWTERWQGALFNFLFPPLLVIIAAIAIVIMGPTGRMIGLRTEMLSYCTVLAWLSFAIGCGGQLAYQGWQSARQIRALPQIAPPHSSTFIAQPLRLLEVPQLFCARIGFWQPEFVVSRGLLDALSPQHLEAVLAHEQAHGEYRDTFWFFWLGWLRRICAFLPHTEALWQELLTLRELRADRRARDRVDALFVAEALLLVVRSASEAPNIEGFCAAFSLPVPNNRFQERIDALLEPSEAEAPSPWWAWSWGAIVLLPLLAIPFHH